MVHARRSRARRPPSARHRRKGLGTSHSGLPVSRPSPSGRPPPAPDRSPGRSVAAAESLPCRRPATRHQRRPRRMEACPSAGSKALRPGCKRPTAGRVGRGLRRPARGSYRRECPSRSREESRPSRWSNLASVSVRRPPRGAPPCRVPWRAPSRRPASRRACPRSRWRV